MCLSTSYSLDTISVVVFCMLSVFLAGVCLRVFPFDTSTPEPLVECSFNVPNLFDSSAGIVSFAAHYARN